jgi:hypothetical protein
VGEKVLGLPHVVREDRRRESLRDVVVDAHGLLHLVDGLGRRGVLRAVLDDVEDGREGLVLHDLELVLRHGDARCDVPTAWVGISVQPLSAVEDLTALGHHLLLRGHEGVHRVVVEDRSHQGRVLQRVTDGHVPVGADQSAHQLVLHRGVDDDAPGAGAPLPGRPHRSEQDGRQGQVQVGVGGHDDGVVPTQLQDALAEAAAHHLAHALAHAGRARGRDQRHATVVAHPLPDGRTVAHGQGEDGRIDVVLAADFGGDLRHGHRGERRPLGRLPHGRVAAYGSEGRVPAPHGDREVERADDPDHPQGVPLLPHVVVLPLRGQGEAVELPGQAHREVADVDHLLDLALTLGQDLPHLQGDQGAQGVLLLPELVPQLTNHLAPLRRRNGPPLQERLVRPVHDAVVLLLGHGLDGADHLAVHGGADFEHRPGADPLAVESAGVRGLEAEFTENLFGGHRVSRMGF